jgi:hypothetical protein
VDGQNKSPTLLRRATELLTMAARRELGATIDENVDVVR